MLVQPGRNLLTSVMTSLSMIRCFSTVPIVSKEYAHITSRRQKVKPDYKVGDTFKGHIPRHGVNFPEYPYGEARIYKQSDKGLYGGKIVRYGNNISESKAKTRRRWEPSIYKKKLWSETLNRKVGIRVASSVLRTMDKVGGLDNYLVKDKSSRIKELGMTGWKLRYMILKKKEKAKEQENNEYIDVENNGAIEKRQVYFDLPASPKYGKRAHKVIVGRRKLLKELFPFEKEVHDSLTPSDPLTFRTFMQAKHGVTPEAILASLYKFKYDLSKVTA